MKSSYKALKINSLCYRDRFVKKFPLFLTELKEKGLYEDFLAGKSSEDSLVNQTFYDLSNKNQKTYLFNKEVHIQNSQKFLKNYSVMTKYEHLLEKKQFKMKNYQKNETPLLLTINTAAAGFSNLFSLIKGVDGGYKNKTDTYNREMRAKRKSRQKATTVVKEMTNVQKSDFRAEDLIVKDKIFEEEYDSFLKEYGLFDYSKIEYDATKDYTFHDTDATIFARKQRKELKKEKKKERALRKQEKLEREKKEAEELAKKPKNPSFYDLLNIPLELRIAKYDIPLPSEEDEEEEVVEYTPIDWEAEDLKYLIIVPHIRDIKFFDGSVGFSFGMYTGNKLLPVAVTESRVGSFLGSFIFTKRITREIHAKKNKKSGKRK